MDSLLLILKLLGVVSTAVFGILGTMHDFRTKDGKLTKWGKASIAGTIVSVFVAVSAQLVENYLQSLSTHKAALQTLESTQRSERIITELNRTMQPLESISVHIGDLGLPMDDQFLQSYKQRLNNALTEFFRVTPSERWYDSSSGLHVPSIKTDNGREVPLTVRIYRSNPLFPRGVQESLVRSVLDIRAVELAFYRVPIAPSDFHPFGHGLSSDPDLRVSCFNRESLYIQKSLEKQTFHLSGTLLSQRAQWEDKSAKIRAVPDLAASQLFISFAPLGVEDQNDRFLELRSQFSLNAFKLHVGNRSKWIRSATLKKHQSAEGITFWEFVFPANEDFFANESVPEAGSPD